MVPAEAGEDKLPLDLSGGEKKVIGKGLSNPTRRLRRFREGRGSPRPSPLYSRYAALRPLSVSGHTAQAGRKRTTIVKWMQYFGGFLRFNK